MNWFGRCLRAGSRAAGGRAVTRFRKTINDRRGLASVEFAIVMGAVGVTFIVGAQTLAPALHDYLVRIENAVKAANAALQNLPAGCHVSVDMPKPHLSAALPEIAGSATES